MRYGRIAFGIGTVLVGLAVLAVVTGSVVTVTCVLLPDGTRRCLTDHRALVSVFTVGALALWLVLVGTRTAQAGL